VIQDESEAWRVSMWLVSHLNIRRETEGDGSNVTRPQDDRR
jgi:hypothetical protein